MLHCSNVCIDCTFNSSGKLLHCHDVFSIEETALFFSLRGTDQKLFKQLSFPCTDCLYAFVFKVDSADVFLVFEMKSGGVCDASEQCSHKSKSPLT